MLDRLISTGVNNENMGLIRAFGKLMKAQPCFMSPFSRQCESLRNYCRSTETERETVTWCQQSLNEVRLIGTVGKDPTRYTSPQPFTLFSMVTNKYFKNESGTVKELATWHNVFVWNSQLQDYVLENVVKGSRVYLLGYISYKDVVDESSGKRYNTASIVALNLEVLRKPHTVKPEVGMYD